MSFLTRSAAPILDPAGCVLDISGQQRDYHRHTLGPVRAAAHMVEHRLFETRHAGSLRLRLHAQPEGLGTVTEGLLAPSDEGWLIGADPAACGTSPLRYCCWASPASARRSLSAHCRHAGRAEAKPWSR